MPTSSVAANVPGASEPARVTGLDFDLSPMSALLIDMESMRIRAANSAAESLYGYGPDELRAMRLDDLIVADQDRHPVAARTLSDGSVVESEVQQHRRRDGSTFPALCASRVAVRGGKAILVINVFDAGDLRLGPAIRVDVADGEATRRDTILVVEDDPMVRAPVCRALRRAGYDILEAVDGEDALRVMQEYHEPIPLVISDIMMPELRGTDLIEMLHGWYPRMRVLFISGYSPENIYDREELAQCSFLAKPFTMGDLTQRVRALLSAA